MSRTRLVRHAVLVVIAIPALTGDAIARARVDAPGPGPLIGLWRGTSTCTDRVAAPACQDERVVYEFTAGTQPGLVHWAADKVVNGRRERMGEMDLTYDKTESCWKAEFSSPRVKSVWRIFVNRDHLTGSARLVPGNETVRKVELRRERPRN